MITLKKNEVVPALFLIAGFKQTGEMVSGLLTEALPLSLKRRLQKIREDLMKHQVELAKDSDQIEKECSTEADKERKEQELKVLFDEEIKIDRDKVSLAMIEAITTSNNYDFSLIEKIAE